MLIGPCLFMHAMHYSDECSDFASTFIKGSVTASISLRLLSALADQLTALTKKA